MIIGVPSSKRVFVLKASPFEFSTVTEGTCAAQIADTKSARLKRNVLIMILRLCFYPDFQSSTNQKNLAKIRKKNLFFNYFSVDSAKRKYMGLRK
jgi:hypothetical protein